MKECQTGKRRLKSSQGQLHILRWRWTCAVSAYPLHMLKHFVASWFVDFSFCNGKRWNRRSSPVTSLRGWGHLSTAGQRQLFPSNGFDLVCGFKCNTLPITRRTILNGKGGFAIAQNKWQRIFVSLVLAEQLIWWMNIAFNKTKTYKHYFQGEKKQHYSSPTAKDIFWWRKYTSFPIFWLFIYLFLVNLSVDIAKKKKKLSREVWQQLIGCTGDIVGISVWSQTCILREDVQSLFMTPIKT